MKQASLSHWLKFAIVSLAGLGLLVYGLVLPLSGLSIAGNNPEMAYRFWPWLILFWLTAIPCYAALVLGWKIASDIGQDRSFSDANARRMKWISNLALGDVLLFFLGNLVLFFLSMSHPGVFLLSLLPDMLGVAIAVCAAALSHLIYKSARLQQDADLTV